MIYKLVYKSRVVAEAATYDELVKLTTQYLEKDWEIIYVMK